MFCKITCEQYSDIIVYVFYIELPIPEFWSCEVQILPLIPQIDVNDIF